MENLLKTNTENNKNCSDHCYSIASTSSRCSTPTTSLPSFAAAGSIAHSTVANSVASSSPKHTTLLSQILAWQLVPQSLYSEVPVAPSLMYGAIHLARLFGMCIKNFYSHGLKN